MSTGAHNDFQRATGIARRMVTEFGMSDKLHRCNLVARSRSRFLGRDFHSEQNYSDAIAHEIDMEMQSIMKECYARAKQILTENRDKLDIIAQTLLEVETLDAEQINHLCDYGRLPERPTSSDDVKVNINMKKEDEDKEDK